MHYNTFQVAHFQKESSALAVGRRRLASDRKRLTEEVPVTDMIIDKTMEVGKYETND